MLRVLCPIVKTISVSEAAYQRLVSWKNGQTFSEVIERMIPPKGTIEAAMEAAGALPELSVTDFEDLERVVAASRKSISSAWS